MFEYKIRYSLRRQHYNPPVFKQAHFHVFGIEVTLQAFCDAADMYGIDIIEYENRLQNWAEALPIILNEHPDLPIAATEDLCRYFAGLPTEERVKVIEVSVTETPERATILKLSEGN